MGRKRQLISLGFKSKVALAAAKGTKTLAELASQANMKCIRTKYIGLEKAAMGRHKRPLLPSPSRDSTHNNTGWTKNRC